MFSLSTRYASQNKSSKKLVMTTKMSFRCLNCVAGLWLKWCKISDKISEIIVGQKHETMLLNMLIKLDKPHFRQRIKMLLFPQIQLCIMRSWDNDLFPWATNGFAGNEKEKTQVNLSASYSSYQCKLWVSLR